MRGAISGGMVLGLHVPGLAEADAVYGRSAGALNAINLARGQSDATGHRL